MFVLLKCFVLVNIFFFNVVSAQIDYCGHKPIGKEWKFEEESLPPANITTRLKKAQDNTTDMQVWSKQRQENFTLAVLADPFIRNKSECRELRDYHENLRRFAYICYIFKDGNESIPRVYTHTFTGCYYFIMKNNNGSWQGKPVFHETDDPYINTMVKLSKNVTIKLEGPELTNELETELTIPLQCMTVQAQLWQFPYNTTDCMKQIKKNGIVWDQICWISKHEVESEEPCFGSILRTNLTLDKYIRPGKKDKEWRALTTWQMLQRGGGEYVLRFVPDITYCLEKKIYKRHQLDEWKPFEEDIWYQYGAPPTKYAGSIPDRSNTSFWISISCGILALIVTMILFYKIFEYVKFISKQPRRGNECMNEVDVTVPFYDESESQQILLIYEKGSTHFMEGMKIFGRLLERECPGWQVHDIYATNKWSRISEIPASQWILELLADGSKIVWVDTPQFRSRFDKEKQYTADDFRDDAIPYAVSVAINSFQNSITQYRRHFVVQIKGFEVQAGTKDPLKVVSPHMRYYIPEQLSQLCEDLKVPMNRVTKPVNGGEKLSSQKAATGNKDRNMIYALV